jgi:hypothetical protein
VALLTWAEFLQAKNRTSSNSEPSGPIKPNGEKNPLKKTYRKKIGIKNMDASQTIKYTCFL